MTDTARKPITNADRIRAMSNEELAYLFAYDTLVCEIMAPDGMAVCDFDCENCIREWLQDPNCFPENFMEGVQRNGSDTLSSL